jgi:NhaC family Na+:H+ antiporter
MTRFRRRELPLCAAVVPLIFLIIALVITLFIAGANAVQSVSQPILLMASALAIVIAVVGYGRGWRAMKVGMLKSAQQILPTIPILVLIACVSATWMLSGVVPSLITYGIGFLSHKTFLVSVCIISAVISLMSGSSWTTIATIGVAFMGIGTIWGYSPAWIAGAVISGAYFGDKVSPLSDTTVLASSSCGVALMAHIRNMMWTSGPAMVIALTVFSFAGFAETTQEAIHSSEIVGDLQQIFHITPYTLIIPAITVLMIILRFNSNIVLGVSSICGVVGILTLQPQILTALHGGELTSVADYIFTIAKSLLLPTNLPAENAATAELIATAGVEGMVPTITLILSAMVFGGSMMGTGMLSTITHTIKHHLRRRVSIVSATTLAGISLNACTGDQYLSIILNGNIFKALYQKSGLPAMLLSRTVEDSTSVTSVLIPWNSCGLTQSAVLGVPTLTYLPYCIFNIASPIVSILFSLVVVYHRRLVHGLRFSR